MIQTIIVQLKPHFEVSIMSFLFLVPLVTRDYYLTRILKEGHYKNISLYRYSIMANNIFRDVTVYDKSVGEKGRVVDLLKYVNLKASYAKYHHCGK